MQQRQRPTPFVRSGTTRPSRRLLKENRRMTKRKRRPRNKQRTNGRSMHAGVVHTITGVGRGRSRVVFFLGGAGGGAAVLVDNYR